MTTTGKKVLIGCAIAFGVFVVAVAAIIALALYATKGIAEVADQQLAALRAGDYAKAYSYNSKDFQNSTSLDKFKEFIDAYPSLKNNESSSFSSRKTENDVGTLEGTLKSKEGGVTPIEYKLVKENDAWKILSIIVNPTGTEIKSTTEPTGEATTPTETAASIFDIRLNDTAGSDGYVETHKAEYTAKTPQILTSAYIKNAKKDMTVQAVLVYTKTGEKVGPATNTVEQDGDIISSFTFSMPTKGWAVGDYQIAVKLSNDEIKAIDFTVK
ncbi:MAG: DUF4864 domain-containing protein [Patescibacteria group bacterium]|jgi:hypothetical protein